MAALEGPAVTRPPSTPPVLRGGTGGATGVDAGLEPLVWRREPLAAGGASGDDQLRPAAERPSIGP